MPAGRNELGDHEVDAFVDRNIISFAAWDLVAYLSQHPEETRTLEEFCHLLSRAEGDVIAVIERLRETGVLREVASGEETAWGLSEQAAVRDVVARFVALSTRREQRLDFVRRVLGQVTSG